MSWLAAATVGAEALGGIFSAKGQSRANAVNKAATDRAMAYNSFMSNTQYQRGMQDMRKAGLNPILAYKQGGASAPTAPTYRAENENKGFEGLGRATGQAMIIKQQGKLMAQQADTLKSQERLNTANSALSLEKATTEASQREYLGAQTTLAGATVDLTKAKTQSEWDKITGILLDNSVKLNEADMSDLMTKIDIGIKKGKTYHTARWIEVNFGIRGKDALELVKSRRNMLTKKTPNPHSGNSKSNSGKSVKERYESKNPTLID